MYKLTIPISALAFFVLPFLIISVIYLLIGLRLYREWGKTTDTSSRFRPESLSAAHMQKQSTLNMQVMKMLCKMSLCCYGDT